MERPWAGPAAGPRVGGCRPDPTRTPRAPCWPDWSTTRRSSRPATPRWPRRRRAHRAAGAAYADLVGTLVVRDTDLAACAAPAARLSVVVHRRRRPAAPVRAALARRPGSGWPGSRSPLRDLDDLAGNARRVVAAVDAAAPTAPSTRPRSRRAAADRRRAGWLAAADEVAERRAAAEVPHRRRRRRAFPSSAAAGRAGRRRARPRDAVQVHRRAAPRGPAHASRRTGFEHHGFLNVLLATRAPFDGAGARRGRATLERPRRRIAWPRRAAAPTSPAPRAGSRRSAPARSPNRSNLIALDPP